MPRNPNAKLHPRKETKKERYFACFEMMQHRLFNGELVELTLEGVRDAAQQADALNALDGDESTARVYFNRWKKLKQFLAKPAGSYDWLEEVRISYIGGDYAPKLHIARRGVFRKLVRGERVEKLAVLTGKGFSTEGFRPRQHTQEEAQALHEEVFVNKERWSEWSLAKKLFILDVPELGPAWELPFDSEEGRAFRAAYGGD